LNLRQNRYERYVPPLNYKLITIKNYTFMNLSFNQLIILILIGFLLFGDVSFILKNINLIYKKIQNIFNNKSKTKNRKKGI
jgi:hypothetical protein